MLFPTIIAMVLGLILSSSAQARLATKSDMSSETLFYERAFDVNADGTYTETVEIKVRILTEHGKRNRATYPVRYDGGEETLKVLEAKTLLNGREYPVPPSSIEDKEIASNTHGFSNTRQVMLSFPHVQTNAIVHLKYERKCIRPVLKGYFSVVTGFWTDELWKQGEVKINSQIPLNMAVNDVKNRLKIDEKTGPDGTKINIKLKEPYLYSIIEERESIENDIETPFVAVSTLKSWSDISTELTPHYEKVLAQPLPPVLSSILAQAPKGGLIEDRIDYITSHIAKEFEYMGDWRTAEGRYFPQDLAAVSESRRGDCKDFATLTVALLRRMGIKADIAIVHRGIEPYFFDLVNLPSLASFNHVIVKVTDQGVAKWIDPTNFTSFSKGIFPDIAGRKSLVLTKETVERDDIPGTKAEDNQIRVNLKIDFTTDHESISGNLERKGLAAVHVTGLGLLRGSRDNADYYIMSYLTMMDRVERLKLEDYELHSRLVKDQIFNFSFEKMHKERDLIKTTLGEAFLLNAWPNDALLTSTKSRFSDLSIMNLPSSMSQHRILSHGKLVGQGLTCTVTSPWLDLVRTIADSPNGVEIRETATVKKPIITIAELRTSEFTEMQKQFGSCFGPMAVIFTLPPQFPNVAP